MTDEEISRLLRPRHDGIKVAQFVIAAVLACATIAGIFIAIGKNQAAIDDIKILKDQRQIDHDDITSIRYEAKSANAGVQRVEQKFDDGLKDINEQLRQIRIRR